MELTSRVETWGTGEVCKDLYQGGKGERMFIILTFCLSGGERALNFHLIISLFYFWMEQAAMNFICAFVMCLENAILCQNTLCING